MPHIAQGGLEISVILSIFRKLTAAVFLVEFSLTDHTVGFEVLNIPKMIIFIYMDNDFEQPHNTSF